MTKLLRPDQFPPWYDGQSINEAAFCREFLASHKLLYTENSFFTPEGRMTDVAPLKTEIYQIIEPYDVRFGKGHADEVPEATLATQVKNLGLNYSRVQVVGGKEYLDRAERAFGANGILAETPFRGLGIGQLLGGGHGHAETGREHGIDEPEGVPHTDPAFAVTLIRDELVVRIGGHGRNAFALGAGISQRFVLVDHRLKLLLGGAAIFLCVFFIHDDADG